MRACVYCVFKTWESKKLLPCSMAGGLSISGVPRVHYPGSVWLSVTSDELLTPSISWGLSETRKLCQARQEHSFIYFRGDATAFIATLHTGPLTPLTSPGTKSPERGPHLNAYNVTRSQFWGPSLWVWDNRPVCPPPDSSLDQEHYLAERKIGAVTSLDKYLDTSNVSKYVFCAMGGKELNAFLVTTYLCINKYVCTVSLIWMVSTLFDAETF